MYLEPVPMGKSGKIKCILNLLLIFLILLVGFIMYLRLPHTITAHFDIAGNPTRYGSRAEFLLIPISFALIQATILLIVKFRFTLFNKAPYLVNLPAFFTALPYLDEKERSIWFNRYFELMLELGIFFGIYFLMLMLLLFDATASGTLLPWRLTFTIGFPILGLLWFLVRLSRLNRELMKRVRSD